MILDLELVLSYMWNSSKVVGLIDLFSICDLSLACVIENRTLVTPLQLGRQFITAS